MVVSVYMADINEENRWNIFWSEEMDPPCKLYFFRRLISLFIESMRFVFLKCPYSFVVRIVLVLLVSAPVPPVRTRMRYLMTNAGRDWKRGTDNRLPARDTSFG
jgi:hypothetical protein